MDFQSIQFAWNSPTPFDTRIAHGGVGVQAFGDGMADDSLTLLFEQGDELLLLLNQRINLRRLVVEELGDLGCSSRGEDGMRNIHERILGVAIDVRNSIDANCVRRSQYR